LLGGRWISENEPPTNVVINESLARRDFPAQDPVGRRIRLHSPDAPFATIVGVVADLRYAKLDERPAPEVYVSYSREPPGGFTAILRASVDPSALAGTMRTTLSDIDRALPIFDVQTLEQALADSIAPRRFNLFLLAVFAAEYERLFVGVRMAWHSAPRGDRCSLFRAPSLHLLLQRLHQLRLRHRLQHRPRHLSQLPVQVSFARYH